jgi:hypothetical protein
LGYVDYHVKIARPSGALMKSFSIPGLLVFLLLSAIANAQVSVVTGRNNNSRTGQNPKETVLNTTNVIGDNFRKLFERAVDGQIYAQPLYLSNVTIAGKTRNAVYVATEHNSVYAFDADDANAPTLWKASLGPTVPSQDICVPVVDDCPYKDLLPEIGITSTPVIDPATGTLYAVAKNKDSDGSYHFRLHALDVATGAEKFAGSAEVTAAGFEQLNHLNRPALLLQKGLVYVAFGSVADLRPWQAWVMAHDAVTLQQVAVRNLTPNGVGGIWHPGGLAGDGNNVYLVTGNGTFDVNVGGSNYGTSFVKLSSSDLTVLDYFTPMNESFLGDNNIDLGSSGPMLIPGTTLLVSGAKDGIVRLLDTTNMGGFNPNFNNDIEEFQATPGIIMGPPAYWNTPNFGPAIYLWGPGDTLKAWRFTGQLFDTTPVSQSSIVSVAGHSNAAQLAISANGSKSGTGIVWTTMPTSGDAVHDTVPGVLRAFDATDLSRELWNSLQKPDRDDMGSYAKFTPPIIANGKVYLATFSGRLLAYGLNTPPDFRITASPNTASVGAGQSANYTISIAPLVGFSNAVSLNCSGLPQGASCAFDPAAVTPDFTTPATTTLRITTTARSSALLNPPTNRQSMPLYALLPLPAIALAGIGLGSRRRRLGIKLSGAVMTLLLCLSGCGGGGTSSGGGNGGTPAGSYSINVTATSGSLQHSTALTLDVQ